MARQNTVQRRNNCPQEKEQNQRSECEEIMERLQLVCDICNREFTRKSWFAGKISVLDYNSYFIPTKVDIDCCNSCFETIKEICKKSKGKKCKKKSLN